MGATGSGAPTRVPIGSNGLVLTADSTSSTGVSWQIGASGGGAGSGIPNSTVAAKGDLIVASAPNTPARLPVGTDGQVLAANSAASGGVSWSSDLANTLSDLAEGLDAASAALATATDGVVPSGPSANRGAPTLGKLYLDTDLGYLLCGFGTAWKQADGTALTSAGGSNAPQNFTAVVNSDNTITLSWSAVGGATSYKLYETASPTGVSGATALTTTTTTRSPGTLRTYSYWVTALVSGVESAESTHASATLPFGGGTGAGSPAALLNIGGVGGYWDIGIGLSTGHINIPQSQLLTGYTNPPYFMLNSAGDAVQFQIFTNGARTSDTTDYPRSELREYNSNGTTKSAWTAGSGSHVMQYDARVLHLPPNKPWVTVGQIHDSSSDALSIKFKGYDGEGPISKGLNTHLKVVATLYDGPSKGGTEDIIFPDYSLNTWTTIKIELISGTLRIYRDGVLKVTSSLMSGKGAGHYFKLGDYLQTAVAAGGLESSSEYGLVEIRNLTVTHSPAL